MRDLNTRAEALIRERDFLGARGLMRELAIDTPTGLQDWYFARTLAACGGDQERAEGLFPYLELAFLEAQIREGEE